ncbi:MAG: 5-formyltetrahydrofolate cyclo-ligase [Candidatus Azotimanducaceae bacterium]|jgi:5-formyltetrahydrofolate cyclo-ligase
MTVSDLRRDLKHRRLSLDPGDRGKKSLLIQNRLLKYLPVQRARHIAIYLSIPGEVDTAAMIDAFHEQEKAIYLPVINNQQWRAEPLLFHRFIPGETALRKNRFGIREPEHRIGECVRGVDMDLVCAPLVGFNQHLDRIGMGGGYYDRCFKRKGYRKTRLVGLAFNCQQAEFEPEAHDVPMDAVVTESEVLER